jgi:predicted permease
MTIYRLLLLAFPKASRREFGEDMAQMFAAQVRAAKASGASMTRFWIHAIADAAWHGGLERRAAIADAVRQFVSDARRWRWWMHAIRQDLSYSLRLMLRAPGATAIALLTLAVGIGANAAIFSAVDALLLRPLPYADPDRLVMIWEKRIAEGGVHNVVAPADYVDWSRATTSFESMAGFAPATADLTGVGEPVRLFSASVSPSFFELLGVRMALGRTFRADEATFGRHRVVILDHGLWQRRFGGDPAMIGRSIALNGNPHEIVGVLPQSFEYPDSTIEIWGPLALTGTPQPPSRGNHFLNVYARLKTGTTIEQARAEMEHLSAQLSEQYPESNRMHRADVVPLRDELVGPVRTSLLLLLAAVGFVLLIACVNVANLLLARAAARRRELAVRAALGAGRGRLARQALTESVLLGILGGVAGLIVATWGVSILHQIVPRNVPLLGVRRIGIDARVLLYSFGLSLVTGVVFGLLPAWHFASQSLNDALKDGGRSQGGGVRRRLRASLVVSEIALASLLLVGAGLSLRSFQTVLRTDAGISTNGVLTALVTLPSARYRGDDHYAATFQQIEDRFRSIPGVKSVGATVSLPLSGQDGRRSIEIEDVPSTAEAPTRAHGRAVTVDYFRTMNIQLTSGRAFTAADRKDAPLVVVVNETMARRYWPGASPLGRRFRLYCPLPQLPFAFMNFVIATDGDPASFATAVREALREIDPDLPLSSVRTMDEVVAASTSSRRAAMSVLGAFGVVALILAAAGIYGVMSHLVSLRTSEIGVRVTMGARRSDIMRLILGEGLMQALAGLAIGLASAVLLMRSFRSLLYEVSPADPVTLAGVGAILLATALLACVVPARRAMNVDPVTALRQ